MASIPGYPTNTKFRTIAWDLYQVPMCASADGCSKKLNHWAHMDGRVDRAGTIHWDRADMRITRRGLRNLLKLMALVVNRDYWTEPRWKRIYLQSTWAYREGKAKLHIAFRARWSDGDRLEVYRLTRKKHLRWSEPNLYRWMMKGVQ